MKLLVRAPNWVGDVIMAVPAMRALRDAQPAAEITVLARPSVAEIYAREPFADQVVVYERAGFRGKLRLAAELRERTFDRALLLPNSFNSALIAWLARIPRRIGYARDGRRWLLTDPIETPAPGSTPPHQRFYYLELLRRGGFIDAIPDGDEIRIGADPEAGRRAFRSFGLDAARVIGVSPGAAFGGAKRWLPERFAAAASTLAGECEADVAVFGTPAERELCEAVAASIEAPVVNLAGRTSLGQFIDLASACAAFLTNDSGAMHIAAAAGVPTIAVFGATDAQATGPVSSLARIVQKPVECSPCLLRECPIDHRCMTGVETAMVESEARQLAALPVHGHASQNH